MPLVDSSLRRRWITSRWMRRSLALFLLFLTLTFQGPIAREAEAARRWLSPSELVLEALRLVKTHFYRADALDWDSIEPPVRKMAAEARTVEQAHDAIRALLREVDDAHSKLIPWRAWSQVSRHAQKGRFPEVKIVEDRLGHVRMTYYLMTNRKSEHFYIADTWKSMARVERSRPCGWIVDVRSNSGGNGEVMLGALKPLLGETEVLYFVRPGAATTAWIPGSGVSISPPPAIAHLASAPAAVLVDEKSASAAEMVAIAFVGREHSRLFGQPTVGASTDAGYFDLGDAKLQLAVGVMMDRNGKTYGGPVVPDEIVSRTDEGDAVLEAATRWLRQTDACKAAESGSAPTPGGRAR